MPATATEFIKTFARNENGAIVPLFGLMFTAVLMSMGVAIDLARINHTQTRLTSALDAAALAGGRALLDGRYTDSEVEQITLRYFQQNIASGGDLFGDVGTASVTLDRDKGAVTINAPAVVPMTVTAIAGFTNVTLPGRATVVFEQQDVELALQLDVTGSMCNPCSKIADLKAATADLLDIVLPDAGTTNKVRVGLAPFSSGINLGTYAALATNGRNGGSNCVYERVSAGIDTDEAPAPGRYFKGKADLPSASGCSGRVVPLTDDKAALKAAVTSLSTGGSTAGQIGTQWAWNLVSPKWGAIWPGVSKPVEYRDGKTNKIVVLMTDGEYNTFDGQCDNGGCTPYGARGVKSNTSAKSLCANIKKEGVTVFTVGFMLNHPEALKTLGECASSADHFFRAENGQQLREAFAAIGNQINNLRLTQ